MAVVGSVQYAKNDRQAVKVVPQLHAHRRPKGVRSRVPETEILGNETRVVGVTYLVGMHHVEGYRAILHNGVAQIDRGVLGVASFGRSRKLEAIAISSQ